MRIRKTLRLPRALWLALSLLAATASFAGVSREIQERYRQRYENKALFLKMAVFAEREYVLIAGRSFRPERTVAIGTPRFKVADQVRVLGLDFGRDEIKFRLGAIGGAVTAELIFKFDSELLENFPNSDVFDSALEGTFTEGLRYSDLEEARRTHTQSQFERIVGDLASNTGTSREAVLGFIAPRLPAHQDALRELDTYKRRNQEQAGLLEGLQDENRRLQADLRGQQAEAARLRAQAASLQEKIDNSTSQLTRIREDLRSAQGERAGYQKEIANLQRSLNLRMETGRDISSQIAEISRAAQKLRKERDDLEQRAESLQADVQRQSTANARLTREIDDLNGNVRKMRDTIATLTSKEDSLARQYIELKQVKDTLELVKLTIAGLGTVEVDERTEGGFRSGRVDVYLSDVKLGAIDWRLPDRLAPNAAADAEARFSSESIDYVKVSQDARPLLQTLGERLRLQMALEARDGELAVTARQTAPLQEIGERDQAAWSWRVENRSTEDARLVLTAGLVNKNNDDLPLWKEEHLVQSAGVVRQVRSYLQPVPLALGAVVGVLFCGIVSVFRRPSRRRKAAAQTAAYVDRKGL